MARHVGTFNRSLDSGDDDRYALELDFTDETLFTTNVITSLVVTATVTPVGVTAPVLGSPSYATANKPNFRATGGTAGDVRYKAVVTNGDSPPTQLVVAFTISTK